MEVDFPIGGAVGNGEYLTPLEQNACQILSGYTSPLGQVSEGIDAGLLIIYRMRTGRDLALLANPETSIRHED